MYASENIKLVVGTPVSKTVRLAVGKGVKLAVVKGVMLHPLCQVGYR